MWFNNLKNYKPFSIPLDHQDGRVCLPLLINGFNNVRGSFARCCHTQFIFSGGYGYFHPQIVKGKNKLFGSISQIKIPGSLRGSYCLQSNDGMKPKSKEYAIQFFCFFPLPGFFFGWTFLSLIFPLYFTLWSLL